MWRIIVFIKLYVLILCVIFNQYCHAQEDISSLLPKKDKVGTWRPVGSFENAIGEDLFLLINGGAEIYHEYGFKKAIIQSYEDENGKSINLEIFEMNDATSAYGIYTFKTSAKGKEIPLGNEALFEDYYLNFWKGNFLITLTGFDSEKETIDGISTIAKVVDAKIKSKGQKPQLLDLLPEENLKTHGIKYLKGNLALFNNYEFGSGDIFGLKEGVIGDYIEYKIFIFKYLDRSESGKWFENARNKIKVSARSDPYDTPVSSDYSMVSRNGDHIFLKRYQEYIIIVIGTATTEGSKIIRKVASKISDSL